MISFFVPGTPAPQGSKKHVGNGVMIESSKRLEPWRAVVAWAAKQHIKAPRAGAIRLDLHFVMPRPKSHFGTGRNADRIKPTAPDCHTQKPDIDKLERAILDALTGVAYRDDSQVVKVVKSKRWIHFAADPAGVYITVEPLEELAA
ncbi:RusA family crossover junction endodeoxyribonuclease [uncultured Tessaracoccus sp.]|uniref:RusA family crossover junction endodeoxyribonuclease n=1 Tax=uncultured Tessaracoccus sp. TaxID=905023 RepID=UPI002617EE95|nr:RusA family crossover junction endodeoxyribonuclease [uncultured Tessaracoccus sp.]